MNAPVAGGDPTLESFTLMRELVAAVCALNRPELLDQGRELKMRRNARGRMPMVDLVDRESGEILDELPPEEVLRMMAELEKEREGER
jgi:uncharacterized FlaG/YvyC family protein